MNVKFDKETAKFFRNIKNIGVQTTVCMCENCGLFYKPRLGHECKIQNKVGEKK